MHEVGLSDLVGQVHAHHLSELLTAIDRVQWSRIELHRNRYLVRNGCNGPVSSNCNFVPWDAELWRISVVDALLDAPSNYVPEVHDLRATALCTVRVATYGQG